MSYQSNIYINQTYLHNNSTGEKTQYNGNIATIYGNSKYTDGYRFSFELPNNQYVSKKRCELSSIYIYFTNTSTPIAVGYYLPSFISAGSYNDCGLYNLSKQMYYTQPQTINDNATFYTHTGAYPPYVIMNVSDIVPTVINLYPGNSTFINPKNENTFSWEFDAELPTDGIALTQTSATIQWKSNDNDSINEIPIIGNIQNYTFPADTFPQETGFMWRIRVTSDDNINSEWTQWISVITDDAIGTVENIMPSNMLIDGEIDNKFTWNYNNKYGTPPYGYEIQQTQSGTISWETIASNSETSDCFAIIPAKTLLPGNVQIRVRAYNSQGDISEWSTAEITVRSSPNPPTIYKINSNSDKPTFYWDSNEQTAFEIIIKSSSGQEIYNTYQTGGTKNYKINKRIDDGTYMVYISITNNYGLPSNYSTRQFTVSTDKPPKPEIVATPIGDYVKLTLTGTTNNAVLIRNGIVIADVSNMYEYNDYTAPRYAEYVLRSLSDNAFCDSDPVICKITVKYATIAATSSPETRVKLYVRANEQSDRTVNVETEYSLITFAGRKYPVAEIGEHISYTKSLSFSIFSENDLNELLNMVGNIVIWRDKYEKIIGIMSDFSHIRYSKYINISFSISRIDDDNEEIVYE